MLNRFVNRKQWRFIAKLRLVLRHLKWRQYFICHFPLVKVLNRRRDARDVLMSCPLYTHTGCTLFRKANALNLLLYSLSITDQFKYILSRVTLPFHCAKTCRNILDGRCKLLLNSVQNLDIYVHYLCILPACLPACLSACLYICISVSQSLSLWNIDGMNTNSKNIVNLIDVSLLFSLLVHVYVYKRQCRWLHLKSQLP